MIKNSGQSYITDTDANVLSVDKDTFVQTMCVFVSDWSAQTSAAICEQIYAVFDFHDDGKLDFDDIRRTLDDAFHSYFAVIHGDKSSRMEVSSALSRKNKKDEKVAHRMLGYLTCSKILSG